MKRRRGHETVGLANIEQAPEVTCPACGGSNIARFLYGEPASSLDVDEDLKAGRAVLGGCVVQDAPPKFRCNVCGAEFAGSQTSGWAAGSDEPGEFRTRIVPSDRDRALWPIGRLVLVGPAASAKQGRRTNAVRRSLLVAGIRALVHSGISVRYLLAPAGYLKAKVPVAARPTHGWTTCQTDFESLRSIAEGAIRDLVDEETRSLAMGHISYLVAGVDIYSEGNHDEPHAEFAVVFDMKAGVAICTTGKTYPTTQQQSWLIRNSDAGSHLLEVGEDRLAILVCHDLMAWSPRGRAVRRGQRALVAGELAAALVRPTLALHLPHTVASVRTWTPAWTAFRREHAATLVGAASAILYRTKDDRRPEEPVAPALLQATATSGDAVITIVVGEPSATSPG